MKAIETVYQGYRFRSRLEARWAVFFDALDVVWEYEKEGFDMDGVLYLPDFWLPQFNLWVEIKPFDRVKLYPEPEWIDTITRFRDAGIGAIALMRDPGVFCNLRCWDCTDSSGGSQDNDQVVWAILNDRPVLYAIHDDFERSYFADEYWSTLLERVVNANGEHADYWHDALKRAQRLFRQARFEHGEKG